MNHSILLLRSFLVGLALFALGSIESSAQRRDSLVVFQTNNGEYESCFDFILQNRQRRGTKIAEFRLTILTDSATFIAGDGKVESPPDWNAFLGGGLRSIIWYAETSAELDSGESIGGFRVCASARGVIRVLWETANIDSVLTRDTLVFAVPGKECDEVFARPVRSNLESVFDLDLVSRNGSAAINTFILQIATPGVTFDTSRSRVPAGWRVSRANADTLVFATTSNAIPVGGFAEGFRIRLNAPRDSNVRIEYWTRNFTRELCRDTLSLVPLGFSRQDSVTVTRNAGCCDDIRLKNTHQPASTIEIFTIRTTTPGVTISTIPAAPAGWTRLGPATVTDSVAYGRTGGLAPGDTALFRGICFDNTRATTDTVRFRYRSFGNDVALSEGTMTQICLRPLTRCDSVSFRVDSTFPAAQRCVTATVINRNSRNATIERVSIRVSNPGTRRRILSSTPPANFMVLASGPDSVTFRGVLPAGQTRDFVFCLSNTDAGVLDPLSITLSTEGTNRTPLCSVTRAVNVIVTRECDAVTVTEISSNDPGIYCFRANVANRNDRNRPIDGVQFQVLETQSIFTSATAPAPFSVTTGSFPDPVVGFGGGLIAPGASLDGFDFCLDVNQITGNPKTLTVVWRTFAGGDLVCSDTLRLVGTGSSITRCDSVQLVSTTAISGTVCEAVFRVTNNALPTASLDTVLFRTSDPTARFITASASGWSLTALGRDSALFTGGNVASGANSEFMIRYDDGSEPGMRVVTTTRRSGRAACSSELLVECQTTSVPAIAGSAAELLEMTPNPFSGTTMIRYQLRARSNVSLLVSDALGNEVARVERGSEGEGEHVYQFDGRALPSGIYYFTVKSGATTRVGRLVLVR